MGKIVCIIMVMILFCTACGENEKQSKNLEAQRTLEEESDSNLEEEANETIPEISPFNVMDSKKKYECVKLNLPTDKIGNKNVQILGMDGENLYYYCEGNEANSDLDMGTVNFYEYNMESDTVTNIGSINNGATWSGSLAYLDGQFYLSLQVLDQEHKDSYVAEYCINPRKREVVIRNKETSGRVENSMPVKTNPLVNSITVDGRYYIRQEIERVGEEMDRSILTLCDTKNPDNDKVVISKELTVHAGCVIESVDVYKNLIYTYEWEIEEGSKEGSMYIRTYDIDGTMKSEEKLGKEIQKYLWRSYAESYDSIYELYVAGDYIFLDTWSGYELVLKKEKDGYRVVPNYGKLNVKTLSNQEDIKNKEFFHIVFGTRNENEFYRFESKTGKLEQMQIQTDSLKLGGKIFGNWLLIETEAGDFYKVDLLQ